MHFVCRRCVRHVRTRTNKSCLRRNRSVHTSREVTVNHTPVVLTPYPKLQPTTTTPAHTLCFCRWRVFAIECAPTWCGDRSTRRRRRHVHVVLQAFRTRPMFGVDGFLPEVGDIPERSPFPRSDCFSGCVNLQPPTCCALSSALVGSGALSVAAG